MRERADSNANNRRHSDGFFVAAAPAKRPDESFEDLLARLDSAIEDAIEHDVFVDEINQ